MELKTLKRSFRQNLLAGIALIAGMWSTSLHAVTWFSFGPYGGDARAFAGDPKDPAHIFLGTVNGWIYQTHDGGKKWERLDQIGQRDDLVIDNILVDPADPKHLVVGAWVVGDLKHPDGGLYVSQDGGMTWTSNPDMRGQSIRALAGAPSDAKVMVAGTITGVFRSLDGGAHWKAISPPGNAEIHEVESVAIDPVDPDSIYVGTWHLPWKTTDGGVTWIPIKQGIIDDSDVFSIIVDPKQPNVVYASACSGIYKSEDGGAKFVKAAGIPSSARRTRVLMQDPGRLETVYAGTTEGLYRTDDAGKVWTESTSSDVIVNDVYVDPTDRNHVLLATNRGGVLASDDGGSSFSPSNAGFSSRQITAYVADAHHPATVYVGLVNDKQAGGVFVSHTGGLSWTQVNAGLDGRDVFSLGQAPDGTIVAGTGHGIFRLKDELWESAGVTTTSTPAATGKKEASKSQATKLPLKAKPVGSVAKVRGPAGAGARGFDGSVYGFAKLGDAIYAASSQGLLRSASNGLAWSLVSSIPAGSWEHVAAVKGSIVASRLDAVQVSADNGSTWRGVNLPPKIKQVLGLAVDGQGQIWVGGREGVFVSSDQGASWQMPTGLYVRNVDNIFYDEAGNRMLVTSNGPQTMAFGVQLPGMQVSAWDTGWTLRFVRPMGDHLIGVTLFDGVVVQPKMVESTERAMR